jgi:hypothetical protein
MKSPSIGLREITLLTIGGSYALMMFNLGDLAIIAGWVTVVLWMYGIVRGPRPSGAFTTVVGATLFFMTMWWPDNGWAQLAIPLLWVGVILVVLGVGQQILARRTPPA